MAQQQVAEATLTKSQQRKQRIEETYRTAFATCERACSQQRTLLRELEDLKRKEREMYELEHAKDQVMWARDSYFPPAYGQATWHRLVPFFRLPGWVVWGRETVEVELRPFNDRQLNRDLEAVCEKVNAQEPHLPDGRQLRFKMRAQGPRGEGVAVLMRTPL